MYAVMPPEGVLESRLPNFRATRARVLAAPALGARFAQILLQIAADGGMEKPRCDSLQHFLYVVEGAAELVLDGATHRLTPGQYAYVPVACAFRLRAADGAATEVMWIQKPYQRLDGVAAPAPFVGDAANVAAVCKHTEGRTWQHLLPDELGFDFAVNILAFEPGNYFPMVETHVMEHGLYMLEGQGMYLLQDQWHECWAKDFIYMAPFCPQFFYATGWSRAAYLLYKDVNRDVAF
ncbi:(S)-ureidoglycine aminohydrolase [Verticiella sediminum]|uniref:(S)-ureidoglycine aminohydrolase n=2 Tax=Verticiella sediminum TaxID=1247510 RepID=A0A556ARR4_9BURK|nr:(S)-ureidoglycine aminohydrolase [Verticiella sediminum]